MMKPPKERLKSKLELNIEDLLPIPSDQIPEIEDQVPPYYKYKLAVIDLIEHDFLPKLPKELKHLTGDAKLKWQVVELMMRCEYCDWLGIPYQLANKLVKIDNSYGIETSIAAGILRKSDPMAKFQILYSDEKKCTMQARLDPSQKWTPHTFDIIDAEKQHLLDKNNPHWDGDHGKQKMLAKCCWMDLVHMIARHVFGGVFFADLSPNYNGDGDNSIDNIPLVEQDGKEVSFDAIQPTQQQEIEAKTQIVSFSKSVEPEPIKEEVYEIAEIVEPVAEPINTSPITPEEIKEIRDQKISELPPSANDPIDVLEPIDEEEMYNSKFPYENGKIIGDYNYKSVCMSCNKNKPNCNGGTGNCYECDLKNNPNDFHSNGTPKTLEEMEQERAQINMLAREEVLEPEPQEEESKRKTKKTSKKSIKDITEKPDTSFLNKEPLKEIPMKELKKPFGMSQLTINDPKFHNEITYNRIGDDWYRSLTIQEFNELAAIDMNITAFQTVLQQVYPDLLPKIDAQFQTLLKETNESEKLAVLYHDALSMIENPPELSIVDLKYMELMEKMILGLEKLAIILKKEQPENPLEFIMKASQGKWTNKEAVWGYKYMQARGLLN